MDLRTVTPAEVPAFIQAVNLGFLHPPMSAEALADRAGLEADPDRCSVAVDGGTVIGTLRSFPTDLSVPGGSVRAAGITGVTVRLTHRRRGTLRALMTRELAATADRGEPVAALIASEWPIYGRFGFGPATEHATYEVDSRAVRFRRDMPGSVELVEPITARDIVEDVYTAHHRRTPGEVQRQGFRWDWTLGLSTRPGEDRWNGQVALYRDPGGAVAGFACFSVDESWADRVPATTLNVDALIAATDDAYAALWRLLCEVDTTRSVRAEDRSAEELLPWLLTDARAVRQRSRSDFLWTRVLDVPTAFSGRTCAREGSVVLEVIDPLGHASGRFELAGGPEGSSCLPTTRSARISVPVQTLSTALLGGARLALLARAGLAETTDDAALALADAMLASPVTPWCSTWF